MAAPSVKVHLAGIKMLFDWLVIGQVVAINPAAVVRGPKHSVKEGSTPVLSSEDTRTLLDVDRRFDAHRSTRSSVDRPDDLHLRAGRRSHQNAG
jgi:site-specific recombinase XerC